MLYTPKDVAALLQLSPATVRDLWKSKRLAGINVGQPGKRATWRVTREALEEFTKRRAR